MSVNVAVGGALGCLIGVGLAQALSAAYYGRSATPWLVLAAVAAVLLTGLNQWVKHSGGFRRE